jgi:hypothetical protein
MVSVMVMVVVLTRANAGPCGRTGSRVRLGLVLGLVLGLELLLGFWSVLG